MRPRIRPVNKQLIPSRFTTEYLDSRSFPAESGCVEWLMSTNQAGYAQVGEWPYNAHVLAYVLYNGPLSEHDVVRHLCHNKICINPSHLEKGSWKDNWKDSEEVHRESNRMRRGRPASNRIPIRVDGETFSSKAEAMKALRRGPRYIEKHGKPL